MANDDKLFWTDVINPIASVASSFGTGLLNNAMAQKNAAEQRAWQEKMWQKQNLYNDPSAIAGRLKAAGLNPYSMTDAQPAGSAGTGATAETFPLSDPLAALHTLAEIENINSSTNRTITESEKLLKEISLLDIAYQRGLIEKEDYQKRLKAYWDAYGDKSEFELQREATEAGIDNTKSDTGLKDVTAKSIDEKLEHEIMEIKSRVVKNIADSEYASAMKETEDLLRNNKNAQLALQNGILDLQYKLEKQFGFRERQQKFKFDYYSFKRLQQEYTAEKNLIPIRQSLMEAGLTEAQAQAALTGLQFALHELDFDYLKSWVGDDGDWYDVVGRLIYEVSTDVPFTSGVNVGFKK